MKILQINAVYGYGSTGLIMQDIGRIIKSSGNEAYFAYQSTNVQVENGYCVGNKLDWKMHALFARLFGKQAYFSKRATKRLLKHIDKIKPDVVHLHNLHSNYINLNMLLKHLAEKDIATVITMHDCWYFTGKCFHYVDVGCDGFTKDCKKCPKKKAPPASLLFDTSSRILRDKKKYVSAIPRLKLVGCSDWICGEAKKGFLKNADMVTIHNGVDTSIFKPQDRDALKKEKGVLGRFVIMGMANKWFLPSNKGVFEKTIEILNENVCLMIVGCNDEQAKNLEKYGDKVISVGFIKDRALLAKHYAMADVFVNITHADTLPTVNMESICCDTPVITYDSCGSPELVLDGCGEIVREYDEDGIIEAIKKQISSEKKQCFQIGTQHYDKEQCYKKYLEVYETLKG